ncbi:RecF/RecN/SMC N terminal domain-domain-containing protein [Syncephalastrum racemosum]|uniref:RecF/RecN/SMC N terminal domain-domain-containing protein n=1 Tax=Syncephalastrum racemosum TaxID=13706 RepID=A0A1X2H5P0_SYNRA|nr:RecF/RecN/SMC N terminal domain-domain-containing protein [Syncephalastrum racemosum]
MSDVRKRHLSESPELADVQEKKRLREDNSQTTDAIQTDLDAISDEATTMTPITTAADTATTPQPSAQKDDQHTSQPSQAPHSPQPSSVPPRKVAFTPDTQSTPPQPQSQSQSQRGQPQDSPEPSKPRLVITKMVLNNFKSYAGRQVIGPFHKSFSAIVGPNGSGKSNVIDSLLFVFGYRANKMRQGKLSELIHNSAKHPNCDSCSVEIHFQEIIDGDTPAAFDRVPNSKLVISRFAYRNNSSKYYINDKTSSFTEVTTLLRKRGIDLDHKRFLILQGEVESIALMKPKAKDENDDGLLEYLEDIIGTSKYKEPIEGANERLEALNEERMEKLNRVRYVGREKDNLEDKKHEAETYLENENELARQKNELYQIFLYEANENIKTATKAIEELKLKLKEEQENHKGIENEINEMNKTHSDALDEYQVLSAKTDKIYKKHAKFEKEDVQIKERKTHLETKMEKAKTSMETDREARNKARDAIKTNGDDLTKRKKDIKELEKQLKSEEKKLEEINAELKGKTDGFRAEIEEHQKELAPWTAKINEKKRAIDVKVSEREILAEKISSGEKAVQNAEEQVKKVEDMRKLKRKEIKAVPKDLENLRKAIADLEMELGGVTEKETTLRSKVVTARQKADEARASMQQKQSQGKILDSLLRMRDSGRIKGPHGQPRRH